MGGGVLYSGKSCAWDRCKPWTDRKQPPGSIGRFYWYVPQGSPGEGKRNVCRTGGSAGHFWTWCPEVGAGIWGFGGWGRDHWPWRWKRPGACADEEILKRGAGNGACFPDSRPLHQYSGGWRGLWLFHYGCWL